MSTEMPSITPPAVLMRSAYVPPVHTAKYSQGLTAAVLEARTALMHASRAGDLGHVARLVTEYPNWRVQPEYEHLEFGLTSALSHNHLPVARYLLDCGAQLTDMVVIAAARSASLSAFDLLLEYGWDVNATVGDGCTAFGFSQVLKDESCVRWFLDHGANPNLGPPHDRQPSRSPRQDSGHVLDTVACVSTVEILDLLLAHGAKLEYSLALHWASQAGEDDQLPARIPMMERLLELGIDINGSDAAMGGYAYGNPLDWARRWGRQERVRFLEDRGAVSSRTSCSSDWPDHSHDTGFDDLINYSPSATAGTSPILTPTTSTPGSSSPSHAHNPAADPDSPSSLMQTLHSLNSMSTSSRLSGPAVQALLSRGYFVRQMPWGQITAHLLPEAAKIPPLWPEDCLIGPDGRPRLVGNTSNNTDR